MLLTSSAFASDTDLRFDGAEYQPDSPTIETTYDIPDISSGLLYDLQTNRLRAGMSLEIFDDTIIPYSSYPLKSTVGAAEDLTFLTFTVRFTSIIEVSAGPFVGYDFQEKSGVVGISAFITKF